MAEYSPIVQKTCWLGQHLSNPIPYPILQKQRGRTKNSNMPQIPTTIIDQYTLAPLIKDGRHCLACSDVEGLGCIVLQSVEFYYGGSPWQKITRKSDDIFALVETDIFQWPALERITAARFQIRFRDEKRPRSITIRPGQRRLEERDESCPAIDQWLVKRKFLEITGDDRQPVP